MASKVVNYIEYPYASDGQCGVGNSSNLEEKMRILKEEIRSCKVDNDKIMQAQDKQVEVNAILRQTLSELHWQEPLRINHGHKDRTNGAYGSRYFSIHRSYISNTIRDVSVLDIPNRRSDRHMYYSSSGSDRHHGRHRYHPYRRSDRGYFPHEFMIQT